MGSPKFNQLSSVALGDPHEPENVVKPNPDGSINVDIVGTIAPVIGAPNFATGQVAVQTTATLIVAARATRSDVAIVNNTGTDTIYVGASNVTVGTGVPLGSIQFAAMTADTTAALYGIVATTPQTVGYIETYT